ncbi:MAG: biotin--[acetyl-CoA-carboxylase] ligase [Bacteroidia bacterium]|nr:MAG: biotin--[acetyl-CoA-carboxylase] ligase [Bacteroidia bacterium]
MFTVIHKDQLDSTNEEAKKLLSQGNILENTIIWAEDQSAGRGQQGNVWHNAKGKNLTFSLVWHPENIFPSEQFYISKAISLGILTCLDELSRDFSVKWPNDIYWKNKKVCGILIENTIHRQRIKYSVIGVGLNVNEIDFPDYLPQAVSIAEITEGLLNRQGLLSRLMTAFDQMYLALNERDFKYLDKAYHERLYLKDKKSQFQTGGQTLRGCIRGTMPDGRLILEPENGNLLLFDFKEIVFL